MSKITVNDGAQLELKVLVEEKTIESLSESDIGAMAASEAGATISASEVEVQLTDQTSGKFLSSSEGEVIAVGASLTASAEAPRLLHRISSAKISYASESKETSVDFSIGGEENASSLFSQGELNSAADVALSGGSTPTASSAFED